MELDELRQAWQTLGHQLERQQDLQWQLLRDRKLDRLRGYLRPLVWGQVLQILLGIGLIVLGVACWSRNSDVPALLATGIGVHVFGVVNIILAGITLGRVTRIDYAAPVIAIQKQNARLLQVYLRNSSVCGLAWWIMWLPVTMAFAGLARIDLTQAPSYIWSGIAVSVIGLAGTCVYIRRSRLRRNAGGQAAPVDSRGDGGDGIRRGQCLLDELARFERE